MKARTMHRSIHVFLVTYDGIVGKLLSDPAAWTNKVSSTPVMEI